MTDPQDDPAGSPETSTALTTPTEAYIVPALIAFSTPIAARRVRKVEVARAT